MAKASGIDVILDRWRTEIKGKQRRIISFEETVDIKINSIKARIFSETSPVDGWEFREFNYTRHRERIYKDAEWRPIKVGQTWGGPDTSAMFRCRARIPAKFAGQRVVLKLYLGGDGLLSIDGIPYHGLDPFRDTVPLTDCATGNETYDFTAESYIFWHFGESEVKTIEVSHFAVMDQEMHDIYWDFRAARNVLLATQSEPEINAFLRAGMDAAIWLIDQNEPDSERFRQRVKEAHRILRSRIYESDRFQKSGLLHLCGNSHLDVVFLWTHAEFVRKLGRTHATTLRLMEQYPEYIFSQSQPLMYQEMKENFPQMYEAVKQRVHEGRWEVIGAFWVEPDCNLISGESFVRQILHGVRFIESEFGITPRTCWCPDVFGNAWTMPQILAKCGLQYFVTHKMVVWNDTNPWRKNTFWWQGPDGSRVLTLVPPTHFIGTIEPDHMAEHWRNFADKESVGESLYNYGWGDGGGGPDVEMLEYLKRYRKFPGVVAAVPNTIEGALDSIGAKSATADLPVVNDELYLEEHRGTFTTKARLKRLNRECEVLYRNAELWSFLSEIAYPGERLEKGWKGLLNNQFHDSLPGSHIHPVYLDLLETYDDVVGTGQAVLSDALSAIAARIDTRGDGRALVVFNSTGRRRDTLVRIPCESRKLHILDAAGCEVPHQFGRNFETGAEELMFEATGLPGVGYRVYRIVDGSGQLQVSNVTITPTRLENEFLKAEVSAEGEIVSLYDKVTGRECINADERGNRLMLYEDVPGKYEAWDIAPSYRQVVFPTGVAEMEIVEDGPVRSALQVTRRFGGSTLRQRIVLARQARRLDFETWVDWHEQQKMLKARFFTPVCTRRATYDIAYGNIERSAYRNNSFEEAKFEVPAHFWMDLSQNDFGISLLNNCKYGHEAFDGMMALTLLRGPVNPDPESDQEEHAFIYSLYPHAGDWRTGDTVGQALDLNDPVKAVIEPSHAGNLPAEHAFLSVDGDGVTIEALKKAEDSDAMILRVVERHGGQSRVGITLAAGLQSACEVNLLECDARPVQFAKNRLEFEIAPYEIRTFSLGI